MMLLLILLSGFLLLIAGGEIVVKGAVALAKNMGLPKAVIGLTIIAYGTSAPELVVSLESALAGHADLSLGNVIGSNISNILLVIGATALVFPITMDKSLFNPDGIALIVVSVMLALFAMNGYINQIEGILFISAVIAYTGYVFYQGQKQGFAALEQEIEAEMKEEISVEMPMPKSLLMVLVGILSMIAGGKMLVSGGIELAELFGVSAGVIGLTIIAVGTSLPELATSVAAARRKHADIAVANVIGSNILNIAGIVGVTSTVNSLTVDSNFLNFDIWLMLGLTFMLIGLLIAGCRINRLVGIIFTVAFAAYIMYQY